MNTQWNGSITNNSYCSGKKGASWRIPSKDEWHAILGNSDSPGESVWREYLNKGVFSNAYYWSTTDAGSGNAYIMLRYMAGNMEIAPKEKSYKGIVRCITR